MNDPVAAAVDRNLRGPGTGAQQPLLLTVTEAARLLRISRNLCYELIAQKQLPHIRLGRRILVPRHGLEQWIAHEAGLPQPSLSVVSWRPPRH
jgi:excisionase family DNA binding protein